MNNYWQIYAFGAAVFAGLTAILAKIGVASISSNLATFIRTVIVCIFLGIWLTARSEWINPLTINQRSLLFLFFSGITTGLSWLLYFRALQIGNVSLVASIDKISLPIAVVLAVVFLGEHLGRTQWVGIAFMVIGSLLIAFK